MNSQEIRSRFLKFFADRGHAVIPSASLVPENDPSVLFTTAGMQPLVPYLLGKPHPAGKRIVNVQKCVRTGDLEDIGDNRHFSFFQMMGNWSLGDYFKIEAILWSYEFLTSKEEGLGLDPSRLYVTVFEGDDNAPFDEESKKIWLSLGMPGHRIYPLGAEDNWWSPGDNGPCGPDTEMFYDMNGTLGDLSKEEFTQAVKDETVVEIWNDVFMEYEKRDGKVVGKLAKQNVDTGAGLERMTAVMQGKQTAYDTDLFEHIFKELRSQITEKKELSEEQRITSERIVADHLRTATFMIADGVLPSNTDRGYVLRRLLRRAVVNADKLGIMNQELGYICTQGVVNSYVEAYPELEEKRTLIHATVLQEENKFRETLKDGLKQFEKGVDAFTLFTSYGFPFELTKELAEEKGIEIDEAAFREKFKAHQDLSRSGAEQKFKGGLADTSEMSVKYHTATHLLHQALREVLGGEVSQKGSNITPERLRFDFAFSRKMTDEEKQKVEDIVNRNIEAKLPVQNVVLNKEEATASGALHFFDQKYPDQVSVYFIGDSLDTAISKEFCGGPHVSNTSELGKFTIQKEEAVSQGVRRIKAILS
ncbi:MAG: alanyl-tRNA synthetase, alanyl-tRNA synthetase [Parcubacteria group bacterium]|nr:alanyl-tRNA synthetase, alanyl-tRNA synthetase [Parcubacteria group bacterium]